MKTLALLVAGLMVVCTVNAQDGKAVIAITEPVNGARVPELLVIAGTVAKATSVVRVIVHPMETSDYWVQQKVNVKTDGTWRVQIHVGRPGGIDSGKRFEVRAVADPDEDLRESDVLPDWPKAASRSDVIEVIRR